MSGGMKRLLIAAEKGDAGAQFNLGVLYDNRLDDNGHSIGGNRTEAMKWLLQAAEQGLPRAQTKLAEMYADGEDASTDYVKAGTWFLVAAQNLSGAQRARADAGYERISGQMTAAQIAAAEELARNWESKQPHNVAIGSARRRTHSKGPAS